jgi:hypothetical protein
MSNRSQSRPVVAESHGTRIPGRKLDILKTNLPNRTTVTRPKTVRNQSNKRTPSVRRVAAVVAADRDRGRNDRGSRSNGKSRPVRTTRPSSRNPNPPPTNPFPKRKTPRKQEARRRSAEQVLRVAAVVAVADRAIVARALHHRPNSR